MDLICFWLNFFISPALGFADWLLQLVPFINVDLSTGIGSLLGCSFR